MNQLVIPEKKFQIGTIFFIILLIVLFLSFLVIGMISINSGDKFCKDNGFTKSSVDGHCMTDSTISSLSVTCSIIPSKCEWKQELKVVEVGK